MKVNMNYLNSFLECKDKIREWEGMTSSFEAPLNDEISYRIFLNFLDIQAQLAKESPEDGSTKELISACATTYTQFIELISDKQKAVFEKALQKNWIEFPVSFSNAFPCKLEFSQMHYLNATAA